MPVGVPVGLLQPDIVPVLPVPPVLLAQPRLLPYPYAFEVESEGPERLVRTAVGRDVHADPLAVEELAQPHPRVAGLPQPFRGQPQGMVGLALVHRVIGIALGLAVAD